MRFEKSHFENSEVRIFFEILTSQVRKNILISKSHFGTEKKYSHFDFSVPKWEKIISLRNLISWSEIRNISVSHLDCIFEKHANYWSIILVQRLKFHYRFDETVNGLIGTKYGCNNFYYRDQTCLKGTKYACNGEHNGYPISYWLLRDFFGGKSTYFWFHMLIDVEFSCNHFDTKIMVISGLRRRLIDFIFEKTTNNYNHIVTSSMTSSSWIICQMKAWKLYLRLSLNWSQSNGLVALESGGKISWNWRLFRVLSDFHES